MGKVSQPEELRLRTKKFALRIIRLFQALPKTTEAHVLGKQLLRCGTSVTANYRAACRARSRPEFIARLGIVAEEADESVLWLELLEEANILKHERLEDIVKEAKELVAIFSTSLKTAKGNNRIFKVPKFTNLPNYPFTNSSHLPNLTLTCPPGGMRDP